MKRKSNKILCIIASLFIFLGVLFAFATERPTMAEGENTTNLSITVNTADVILKPGGTHQLTVSDGNKTYTPTWTSTDDTIATVDANGLITASSDVSAASTTTLTTTVEGKELTVTVTVDPNATEITAEFYFITDYKSLTYGYDYSVKPFTPTSVPSNTVYVGKTLKTFSSSSNVNLLNNPTEIFKLEDSDNWKAVNSNKSKLIEIRSSKTQTAWGATSSQYVYASDNTYTVPKNYVATANNGIKEDSKSVPKISETELHVDLVDDTNTVKYIYYIEPVYNVSYYIGDSKGNQNLITTIRGEVGGYSWNNTKYYVINDFNSDTQYTDWDKKIKEITGFDLTRGDLWQSKLELYVNDEYIKTYSNTNFTNYDITDANGNALNSLNHEIKVYLGYAKVNYHVANSEGKYTQVISLPTSKNSQGYIEVPDFLSSSNESLFGTCWNTLAAATKVDGLSKDKLIGISMSLNGGEDKSISTSVNSYGISGPTYEVDVYYGYAKVNYHILKSDKTYQIIISVLTSLDSNKNVKVPDFLSDNQFNDEWTSLELFTNEEGLTKANLLPIKMCLDDDINTEKIDDLMSTNGYSSPVYNVNVYYAYAKINYNIYNNKDEAQLITSILATPSSNSTDNINVPKFQTNDRFSEFEDELNSIAKGLSRKDLIDSKMEFVVDGDIKTSGNVSNTISRAIDYSKLYEGSDFDVNVYYSYKLASITYYLINAEGQEPTEIVTIPTTYSNYSNQYYISLSDLKANEEYDSILSTLVEGETLTRKDLTCTKMEIYVDDVHEEDKDTNEYVYQISTSKDGKDYNVRIYYTYTITKASHHLVQNDGNTMQLATGNATWDTLWIVQGGVQGIKFDDFKTSTNYADADSLISNYDQILSRNNLYAMKADLYVNGTFVSSHIGDPASTSGVGSGTITQYIATKDTSTSAAYEVKVYYVPIKVTYIIKDINGNEHEITTISTTMSNNYISIPDFTNSNEAWATSADETIQELINQNLSVARNQLTGKKMELYVNNDSAFVRKELVASSFPAYETTSEGAPIIDKNSYTVKVYYGQPAKPTANYVRLPITMYDFAADGMFFEYCLNPDSNLDHSYGYSMYIKGHSEWGGQGLVQDELLKDAKDKGPRLQYTKKAYDLIGNLVNNGIMWNGVNGQYDRDDNLGYEYEDLRNNSSKDLRSFIASFEGKGGSYDDVVRVLSDGIITKDEVTNAYTAAAYMMTYFFDSENELNYNNKVPSGVINSLQLVEMNDGNEVYYIYDSSYKSDVKDGAIQNVLENGAFTNAIPEKDIKDAYYMPLDWADYKTSESDGDQYDNNYLFTTVGEAHFIYNEDKQQYFSFDGDDDVYLYINGKLAMDIGGAHEELSGSIDLNELAKDPKYGLEEGKVAKFTFFHMERHGTGSHFKMVTNIEIANPSLTTDKNAYQFDEKIVNGGVVEAGKPVEYEFILKNDGDREMFNLSFYDPTLDVSLYPKGARLDCRIGYKADGTLGLSNPVNYGDVKIAIYLDDGIIPVNIKKFAFEKEQDGTNYAPKVNLETPIVDKYTTEDGNEVDMSYGYVGVTTEGKVEFTTISQLYTYLQEQYPNVYQDAPGEDAYKALLQEVLLNGIEPGMTIVLRGFNRTMGQDETYTNHLYTYGSDYKMNEVSGKGSTTVRTLLVKSSTFVIDFGKKVTYTFEQLFTTATETGEGAVRKILVSEGNCQVPENGKQISVGGQFGTGTFKKDKDGVESFTYELKKFMNGIETFVFHIHSTVNGVEAERSKYVNIIPATTVYYEDNFSEQTIVDPSKDGDNIPEEYYNFDSGIKYYGKWETVVDGDQVDHQNNDEVGTEDSGEEGTDEYGYDKNYENCTLSSDGSSMKVDYDDSIAPTASFKFTGDGLELYSRTTRTTGQVRVTLYKASIVNDWMSQQNQPHFDPQRLKVEYTNDEISYVPPKAYKIVVSDNLYKDDQTGNGLYQIPVVTFKDLPYDEYYVVIAPLSIYDQVTVENTDGKTETVVSDTPRTTFYLDAVRVSNPLGAGGSVTGHALDVYSKDKEAKAIVAEVRDILLQLEDGFDFSANDNVQKGIVYIDNTGDAGYKSAEYKELGPKNEAYLKIDKAIGFRINTADYEKVSIGLKVPYQVSSGGVTVLVNNYPIQINTATDMYYDIPLALIEDDIIIVEYPSTYKDTNNNFTSTTTKDSEGNDVTTTNSSIVSITRIKLSGGVNIAEKSETDLFVVDKKVFDKANTFRLMRRPVGDDSNTDVPAPPVDDDSSTDVPVPPVDDDSSTDVPVPPVDDDDSNTDVPVPPIDDDDNTTSDDVTTDDSNDSDEDKTIIDVIVDFIDDIFDNDDSDKQIHNNSIDNSVMDDDGDNQRVMAFFERIIFAIFDFFKSILRLLSKW